MRSLVALCLVLGCSADLLSHVGFPAGVQSMVADGDDTMPADVTKLSVTQLTGVPLPYLYGVPSFTFPAAVPVNTQVDSDEITTAVHVIPYAFPSFHAAAVPVNTEVDSDEITTAVHGIPYAFPSFHAAAVPVNTKVDSDDIITAVHGIPNAFPSFHAAAVPVNTEVDSDEITTAVHGIPYTFPSFAATVPFHHNPLTYSSAGYPYHFGFPYNFGYNWAPTTYAAAAPVEVEDSSFEEDD